MKIIYRAEFFRERNFYVGICPELNISSFGESLEDAQKSLQEAIEAFVETCEEMGTLEEVLEEAGFSYKHGVWFTRDPILEEKFAISR